MLEENGERGPGEEGEWGGEEEGDGDGDGDGEEERCGGHDAESEAGNGDDKMSAPGGYIWVTGRCGGGGWRLSWGAGGAGMGASGWSWEGIDNEDACARGVEEQELSLRPLRCPTGMKCQL